MAALAIRLEDGTNFAVITHFGGWFHTGSARHPPAENETKEYGGRFAEIGNHCNQLDAISAPYNQVFCEKSALSSAEKKLREMPRISRISNI
jgi:hypothetical protein